MLFRSLLLTLPTLSAARRRPAHRQNRRPVAAQPVKKPMRPITAQPVKKPTPQPVIVRPVTKPERPSIGAPSKAQLQNKLKHLGKKLKRTKKAFMRRAINRQINTINTQLAQL